MNSLHSKLGCAVHSGGTNVLSLMLVCVLSFYCAGCVGLTNANPKAGSSSGSTAPTISISAPASGAIVSGTVMITTAVSSGTASVQFKIDGTSVSAAVTSAPFDYSLDTTKLSDGSHSLSAVATDAAGQAATSAAVKLTVSNAGAPTVAIVSPVAGATVSGTVAVSTTTSANTTRVQFQVDGTNSALPRPARRSIFL